MRGQLLLLIGLFAFPSDTVGTVPSTTDLGLTLALPWCGEASTSESLVTLCQTIAHSCSQKCVDVPGSYYCACFEGFHLDPTDNKTCTEIPVCDHHNGFCQHICTNNTGMVECSCREGFQLSGDLHSCKDVDECVSETACAGGLVCVNSPGSYVCLPSPETLCSHSGGFATQNPVGLISESTFIGFIIWLILLTFITLALLVAMTVQFRTKQGRPLSKRGSAGASMCYDGPYNPREEEREDRERSARSLELRNPALFGTLHLRSDTSAHTATSDFV